MKLLSGADLAGFIKERHAHQVQQLLNSGIQPKLAIIQVKDDSVIDTYVRLKKRYGTDIGVEVELHKITQKDSPEVIKSLNEDNSINGIIVQLPLADTGKTDEIVNLVIPVKDVDALGKNSQFEPATPMAILWLLAGYNIDLKDKKVLIIGHGRLVGAPLNKILGSSGVSVEVADSNTSDIKQKAYQADVIIAAASSPNILSSDMIKPGAVVVDAGTASEEGKTLGNVTPEVYERDDIIITPAKGGVGPLTVCALFENVIRSSSR
jgi:methylenetetrahydrofolate dehydrogenase (NADP+)/methenyltetrahydrofolate cyclohydrolase